MACHVRLFDWLGLVGLRHESGINDHELVNQCDFVDLTLDPGVVLSFLVPEGHTDHCIIDPLLEYSWLGYFFATWC